MDYLLYGLVVLALLNLAAFRDDSGAVFVAPILLHDLLFRNSEGLLYYGSAALADLLIVEMLGRVRHVTSLTLKLQILSAVAVGLNLMGFLLWVSYLPPAFYENAFVAWYAVALLCVGRRENDIGGSVTNFSSFGRLSINRGTHVFYNKKHPSKV